MKERVFNYLTALKYTDRRYSITFQSVAMMFDIDVELAAQYVREWIHEQLKETVTIVDTHMPISYFG